MTKIIEGVLYIQKDKVDVYDAGQNKLFSFAFPAGTIADLEVMNDEELAKQFAAFIQQNPLLFTDYIIVLGEGLLFTKTFAAEKPAQPAQSTPPATQPQAVQNGTQPATPLVKKTQAELQKEKERFLDLIPFETVLSVEIEGDKDSTTILAANKELCDILQKVLSKKPAALKRILPMRAFQQKGAVPAFTADLAKHMIKKADSVKTYAMTRKNNQTVATRSMEVEETKKKQKIRTFGLVGVFGVLLVILGVMAFPMLFPPKKAKPSTNTTSAAPTPIPPTPTPMMLAVASTDSAQLKAATTITIQYQDLAAAQSLQQELLTASFSAITLKTNTNTTNRSLIIVKPDVSVPIRNEITEIVKKTFPNAIVQENTTSTSDVAIFLQDAN